MKLLNIIDKDLKIVRGREEVKERLRDLYKPTKASQIYNFYCALQLNGEIDTRENMSLRTYQRNIKELKEAKIDSSQSYKIEEIKIFYFNPFEAKEVA